MTDRCQRCSVPHLYKTYVMQDDFPVWFCSTRCRNIWLVHQKVNGNRIHLTMLAIVVGLAALCGIVYVSGA